MPCPTGVGRAPSNCASLSIESPELPIRPDFVGKNLPTAIDEAIVANLDGVWIGTRGERDHLHPWPESLSLNEMSREAILEVLDTAESFVEVNRRTIKKVPALKGRVVASLFFEESTRTRLSFETAAKRLSARRTLPRGRVEQREEG